MELTINGQRITGFADDDPVGFGGEPDRFLDLAVQPDSPAAIFLARAFESGADVPGSHRNPDGTVIRWAHGRVVSVPLDFPEPRLGEQSPHPVIRFGEPFRARLSIVGITKEESA